MNTRLAQLIVLLFLGLGLNVTVQAASEYHVKAAILYNLARMVEWPNEDLSMAKKPFPICFIGDDPFGDALDFIRSKKVRNRALEFHKGIALGQAEDCAILYVSPSEDGRLEDILKEVHALPLLTVSDTEGFAERGVVVNMTRDVKKVHMQVNKAAAKRANLTLSPVLLKLGIMVDDKFKAD